MADALANMAPYQNHGFRGLAPPCQAAAGSVKGRWIMEISFFRSPKMFSFQLPSERLSHRTSRVLSKVALVDNNFFIKYTTLV